MHDAVPAIAALGVSPIVRLPDIQGWMVKRKTSEDTAALHYLKMRLTFLRCSRQRSPWCRCWALEMQRSVC